ncbi:TetR/AcrR family transcriptional regulator [Komagataeibacter sp. AV436]|uniref:TetR/AcrR family transcriptional regulator n=1 Tax=Komagataeibacter melomenusus TaxID=2766578 RepID=A0ABX2AEW3_9PROT|nr:TetR/AcrR family transcriptional regulator [Komagataeibacter melomenusus]MBV1830811.1 TetR/AcrR family transcriptional regulator [Komagataeibacter melomenusus]NPC66182.1 TetR/AcrR family transcriptional regulator [Komagataeibacter melomenusus]
MKTTLRKIVTEAREVFREHGYDGASMQDLASRVGLKKASLYTRFPNKESLVPEVLALTLEETVQGLPDPNDDWQLTWQTLIGRIEKTLEERQRCVGLHLAYGVTSATPEARAAVCQFFTALREKMAQILRLGGIPDPDAVAADTLAQLEGATVWITTSGDVTPLHRAAESACRIAD